MILVTTKPPSTHTEVGLSALEAGKSVVLEKPMCGSHEEGIDLIEKAKSTGKLLTVYQCRRWDPEFIELQWAIEQGYFGNIKIFETTVCGNLINADWLYDWGVHLIDQALIVGMGKPVEISCSASFPEQAETNSGPWTAFIRFDNGRLSIVSMKIGKSGDYPRFSIVGDKGGCAWPTGTGRMEIKNTELTTQVPAICLGREKGMLPSQKVHIPFTPFYQNLYEVFTNKSQLAVKPEEGLLVIDIVLAAIRSCQEGKSILLTQ